VHRREYADRIVERLTAEKDRLRADFSAPGRIRSFVLDEVLPDAQAREIFEAFPQPERMMRRHSLRESKYFAAQLDRYHPILEEILYAFQDPRIVSLFSEITGITGLRPDPELYAAGVSTMVKDSYLNPHLDNSHDARQKYYRVLNSLYYLTPDWRPEYGGNLELWDRGITGPQRSIPSEFNRLVLMQTDRASWHSVSPVVHDGRRTCVSNYYFRERPLGEEPYFHCTSFRGRPEQRGRDLVLRFDNAVRTAILSVVNVPTKHIYRRK
jgi:Rps23 Pro-64 3,4-dihydroxylase Tpa1-like proline 4-hydroxylase